MDDKAIFCGGEKIEKLIYEIRGKQVMFDSDLARLYGCKNGTKTINLAVKRHKDRFPEDFCFQLDVGEEYILRSQAGTAKVDFNTNAGEVSGGLRFQTETAKVEAGIQTGVVGDGLRFQTETSKKRSNMYNY